MSATKFCDSGSASPITFQHPSVAGRPEDRAEKDLQTGRQMQIRRVTVKLKVATRNSRLGVTGDPPVNKRELVACNLAASGDLGGSE